MMGMMACTGKVTITEADIKPDMFYAEGSSTPFTGRCLVIFTETGVVKDEFTYKRGVLHGKATSWYKNGNKRRQGFYKKGQISGKWIFWDEKGNKTMEANYENDSLNGLFISLYANGTIREQGSYANNRRVGKWQHFNANGQPVNTVLH